MNRFIILAASILMTTYSFADASLSGSTKGSPALNSLSAAWRNQQIPQAHKNDMAMVYGGADVSSKPMILPPVASA
jgi:hypothetical protein